MEKSSFKPPLVAIVGRPNVGKSTLFNRFLGKRVAVVHDLPGTTRDRLYGEFRWKDSYFQIVDTGGLLPGRSEGLPGKILEQARTAIADSLLCLLVVDLEEGLTPLDREVAALLRKENREVVVVMNKSDLKRSRWRDTDFFELGFKTVLPVSALHGLGIAELLEVLVKELPEGSRPAREERTGIAVVGRPNTGKSTLVNTLVGENRLVVDDLPGTTRDAVDIAVDREGKKFLLIDTAGLFKKARHHTALDRFSLSRTERGILRSEVVLLLLEGGQPPTRVDSRFIHYALEHGKGCVLGVNKWDISGNLTTRQYRETLSRHFAFARFLPVVFFSALRRHALGELMETCSYVADQRKSWIRTPILNRVLEQAQSKVSPRRRKHSSFKIYYAVQAGTSPPLFRLFVNNSQLLSKNYRDYLLKSLRAAFGLEGVPLKFKLTEKKSRRGDSKKSKQ